MSAPKEIRDQGFTILRGVLDADRLRALRARIDELFEEEGEAAGSEFRTEAEARRLANLLDKGAVFHPVVRHPELLACVEAAFDEPYKLSSLNARLALPGGKTGQPLHVDMGLLADERGPKTVNSVWMLDDFTPHNGSIRVVPGSHRWNQKPQDALDDPLAPHPDEVVVTGRAGDVLVFQAHLWHAGLANRSPRPRLALNVFFCRHDQPQQTWQKKWLSPAVQQQLAPEMRRLLALDDPLNDELCASPVETSGFMPARKGAAEP